MGAPGKVWVVRLAPGQPTLTLSSLGMPGFSTRSIFPIIVSLAAFGHRIGSVRITEVT